ncbi:hypothetical protein O6H91_05G102200 [Diphasiastrum complanatum]|uniref:Uncharacterized protein n=1 Tax=Diphasiastrum complanatum TaxID=34168 RepID=A0ACC2DRK8_DIPCM|nr:hypothetical protein O6H91_05G102200 [Diphasiastrum complanatum]
MFSDAILYLIHQQSLYRTASSAGTLHRVIKLQTSFNKHLKLQYSSPELIPCNCIKHLSKVNKIAQTLLLFPCAASISALSVLATSIYMVHFLYFWAVLLSWYMLLGP